MNRRIVLVLMILGLTSCHTKDESYYLAHPKELPLALSACPSKAPNGMTCEALQALGGKLNQLAYQLQTSPQGFGKMILALQNEIATQEQTLEKDKNNADLAAALLNNKHKLTEYLAVVKWLESPES